MKHDEKIILRVNELIDLKSFDKAIYFLRGYLETSPPSYKIFSLLSICYEKVGDINNALRYQEKADLISNANKVSKPNEVGVYGNSDDFNEYLEIQDQELDISEFDPLNAFGHQALSHQNHVIEENTDSKLCLHEDPLDDVLAFDSSQSIDHQASSNKSHEIEVNGEFALGGQDDSIEKDEFGLDPEKNNHANELSEKEKEDLPEDSIFSEFEKSEARSFNESSYEPSSFESLSNLESQEDGSDDLDEEKVIDIDLKECELFDEDSLDTFDLPDITDDFDYIEEENDIEEPQIDDEISPERRARNKAVEFCSEFDWGDKEFKVLVDIFYNHPWPATFTSLRNRVRNDDLDIERIMLAYQVRELWAADGLLITDYVVTLSWGVVFDVIDSIDSYPDAYELYKIFTDAYICWKDVVNISSFRRALDSKERTINSRFFEEYIRQKIYVFKRNKLSVPDFLGGCL